MENIYIGRYTIEGKAVSVNSVPHGHVGARRAFQAKVIDPWKETIAVQMKSQGLIYCEGRTLLGIATIHLPHNTRTDADNFVKYLQDGAAKTLGVDDSAFASFWAFLKQKRDGAIDYRTELEILAFPHKIAAPKATEVAKLFRVR